MFLPPASPPAPAARPNRARRARKAKPAGRPTCSRKKDINLDYRRRSPRCWPKEARKRRAIARSGARPGRSVALVASACCVVSAAMIRHFCPARRRPPARANGRRPNAATRLRSPPDGTLVTINYESTRPTRANFKLARSLDRAPWPLAPARRRHALAPPGRAHSLICPNLGSRLVQSARPKFGGGGGAHSPARRAGPQ